MKIRASGRSALILAAGLFLCFAAPSQAAEGADDTAPGVRSETAGAPLALHKRAGDGSGHVKHAQRKSSKVAHKSSSNKNADEAPADDGGHAAAISPSVANANAELTSADPAPPDAKAKSARASNILQSAPSTPPEAQPAPQKDMVAADQLNDVDRTLQESAPAAADAPAPAPAPAPVPAKPVAASSTESSPWDQTSLIGKIFIGFGALLTVASAARMFMG
jgi:hypothetical protein